jgi:Domain of unknown function (DUF5710)
MRVDLNVPYAEKDEVKKLGARWDRDGRVWYVPDGVDPKPFARWLPQRGDFNLCAAEAYLVRFPARCWRCSERFTALAFLMAPGFRVRDYGDDEKDGEVESWSRQEEWSFAHYVTDFPPAIVSLLKAEAPLYRRAFSKTTQTTYWANHCPSCKVFQGDFHLFEEPGSAFLPMSIDHVERMKVTRLSIPFEAQGEPSFGIDDADLVPGVDRRQTEQTIFIKPPLGQSWPLAAKRRGGLIDRLKSLVGFGGRQRR